MVVLLILGGVGCGSGGDGGSNLLGWVVGGGGGGGLYVVVRLSIGWFGLGLCPTRTDLTSLGDRSEDPSLNKMVIGSV